ncbi:MAG: transcriptional regulator, MarR family [Polaromonas sp.]|nr:transcriptional regulator, MarR family [Polaromonas sp.]
MPNSSKSSYSSTAVKTVDVSFLKTLVGYNARRASLAIVEVFMRRMAPYDLRIVDFSVLSLIGRNAGITSRQLCITLGIQQPNLVAIVGALEKRELVERQPHPTDRRATGLHLSTSGALLVQQAEHTATLLEEEAAARLSAEERQTLMRLLQKVYEKRLDEPHSGSAPAQSRPVKPAARSRLQDHPDDLMSALTLVGKSKSKKSM